MIKINPEGLIKFSRIMDKYLGNLSKYKPVLALSLASKNPRAAKIVELMKKATNPEKIVITNKPLITGDELNGGFIMPLTEGLVIPQALPLVVVDYGKVFPNGNIMVPKVIGGVKGISGAKTGFLIGKGGHYSKNNTRVITNGLFTADDLIQALFYGGLGGPLSNQRIETLIKSSNYTPEAKQYALENLDKVNLLLQKYNPSRRIRGILPPMMDKGLIPSELILDTKNPEILKDKIDLTDALSELTSWFGGTNTEGLILLLAKNGKDVNILSANAAGRGYNNINSKVTGIQHATFKTGDEIASAMSPNDVVIIKNIIDSLGGLPEYAKPMTDIVMGKKIYNIFNLKKGGKILHTIKLISKKKK